MDISFVQKQIDYTFNDARLLKIALTHRSYLNERERDEDITEHNERLEFLGDAVLEIIVSEFLFAENTLDEGMMTTLRAALVNYKTVGEAGNDINLKEQILLGKGEKVELGYARLSIVADAVEALIGAIYLDGGYNSAVKLVKERILVKLPEIIKAKTYIDAKTLIQEYSQKKFRITPKYKLISSEGKDHEKTFHVGIILGNEVVAEGEGKSKQEAETQAARTAYDLLLEKYGEVEIT